MDWSSLLNRKNRLYRVCPVLDASAVGVFLVILKEYPTWLKGAN